MNKNERPAINPCKLKGRLGGRLSSGRYYDFPEDGRVRVSCCECSERWILFSEKGLERTGVAMRFHMDRTQTVFVAEEKSTDHRDLMVVPCEEKFRFAKSKGTKFYRKYSKNQMGTVPKFSGCKDVEEYLVKERLVQHEVIPGLGKYKDVMLEMESDAGSSSISAHQFENDEASAPMDFDSASLTNSLWSFQGAADDSNAEDRRAKHLKIFQEFIADLTPAQRQAIELVHLKNKAGITQKQAANESGISLDSIRDRLEQAYRKLEKHFPHLRRIRRRR